MNTFRTYGPNRTKVSRSESHFNLPKGYSWAMCLVQKKKRA